MMRFLKQVLPRPAFVYPLGFCHYLIYLLLLPENPSVQYSPDLNAMRHWMICLGEYAQVFHTNLSSNLSQ